MEQGRMILVTLGHLLPLYSPYHQKKIRILNKRKKIAGDIIVLHKCAKNSYSHNIWLLRYRVRPTEIFVLLAHFLPFYSPNNQEKQIFEKNETSTSRDVITVHVLTKNGNHMMYGS